MISQPGDDAYSANNITKGMTTLCCSAGVEYLYVLDALCNWYMDLADDSPHQF